MAGLRRPTRLFRAYASACAVLATSSGAVRAGDLSDQQATLSPDSLDRLTGWYVRFGASGVLDFGSSNFYAQSVSGTIVPGIGGVPVGAGPEFRSPSRSVDYSNFATATVQGGYFFTRNWSVEVATAFPVWSTITVNGYSPGGPPAGTVLGRVLPFSTPITGVYHFTQFGQFQPYLGAGVAPTFALAVRDGYATGLSFPSTLGFVVQGGFDFMLDKHWGVFFDAKQGFAGSTASASGVNTSPNLGPIPVMGTIKTNARPVAFSAGLTYHF